MKKMILLATLLGGYAIADAENSFHRNNFKFRRNIGPQGNIGLNPKTLFISLDPGTTQSYSSPIPQSVEKIQLNAQGASVTFSSSIPSSVQEIQLVSTQGENNYAEIMFLSPIPTSIKNISFFVTYNCTITVKSPIPKQTSVQVSTYNGGTVNYQRSKE